MPLPGIELLSASQQGMCLAGVPADVSVPTGAVALSVSTALELFANNELERILRLTEVLFWCLPGFEHIAPEYKRCYSPLEPAVALVMVNVIV
jgi:hypothetical protein